MSNLKSSNEGALPKFETEDTLLLMLSSDKTEVRRVAAESLHATEAVLLKAVKDEDHGVRFAAVNNVKATPAVLCVAVEDASSIIRESAMKHQAVTEALLLKAVKEEHLPRSDSGEAYYAAGNNAATETVLLAALKHPRISVREAAAKNIRATEAVLCEAAKGDCRVVLKAALQNPNATRNVLEAARSKHGPEEVVWYRGWSDSELWELIGETPHFYHRAASHPAISEATLLRMLRNLPDGPLYAADTIRKRQHLSEEVLLELLKFYTDENDLHAVIHHASVTPAVLLKALDIPMESLQVAAAERTSSNEVLAKALCSPYPAVRLAAARNPAAYAGTLVEALADTDPTVRMAVACQKRHINLALGRAALRDVAPTVRFNIGPFNQ
jgi:hypothetical protein